MTDVVRATLTKAQAVNLTQEVRADVRRLWAKVLDLYEGGAHIALGYASWPEYWEGEFGQSGGRGEQLVRAGRVVRALEAGDADLPLPANDLIARALNPILRHTPEDLSGVWARALEATNGKPTAAHIRQLAEPYRHHHSAPHDPDSYVNRGDRRRKRNLAGVPILNAHVNAANASDNIATALEAGPPQEALRDWLEHADEAARMMTNVAALIRQHLGLGDR